MSMSNLARKLFREVRPRSRLRRGLHFLEGGWQARALILTYHRVVPETSRNPFRVQVTAKRFAQHLDYLRQTYPVVSVDDLVQQLRRRALRHRRQVVLTFDDGYVDNYLHAAPLLQEHGLTAVFYLTAGYIGGARPFWWDELDRLVMSHPGTSLEVGAPIHQTYSLADAERRLAAVHDLCARLRRLAPQEREALLDRLSDGARLQSEVVDQPMTWDQARSLARQGFTLGAHSCQHPSLGGLTEAQARQEVEGSKAILETELQAEVAHFSYPHDDADYHTRCPSPVSRQAVSQAGFTSAVSVVCGVNSVGQDLFALRRITVRDWDRSEFAREVTDAFRYGY
jgi:peptidoglycan/xylan/chitin deacetylase (PgdA/CDA1 family)